MVFSCEFTPFFLREAISMLFVQLGVFHYSRLRMEGDLWAYPLPLDDMGP